MKDHVGLLGYFLSWACKGILYNGMVYHYTIVQHSRFKVMVESA